MPGHYTAKSAAAMAGVSVATLRNHTVTFAAYLSADASPPTGQERRLHDQDIAVLQRVVELRKQGMGTADIKKTLQNEDTSTMVPYIDVAPTVEPQQAIEAHQPAPMATVDAGVIVSALDAIQAHQSELMRRVEEIEARSTEKVQFFVWGFLAGAIVLGIVMLLLWAGAALR